MKTSYFLPIFFVAITFSSSHLAGAGSSSEQLEQDPLGVVSDEEFHQVYEYARELSEQKRNLLGAAFACCTEEERQLKYQDHAPHYQDAKQNIDSALSDYSAQRLYSLLAMIEQYDDPEACSYDQVRLEMLTIASNHLAKNLHAEFSPDSDEYPTFITIGKKLKHYHLSDHTKALVMLSAYRQVNPKCDSVISYNGALDRALYSHENGNCWDVADDLTNDLKITVGNNLNKQSYFFYTEDECLNALILSSSAR